MYFPHPEVKAGIKTSKQKRCTGALRFSEASKNLKYLQCPSSGWTQGMHPRKSPTTSAAAEIGWKQQNTVAQAMHKPSKRISQVREEFALRVGELLPSRSGWFQGI